MKVGFIGCGNMGGALVAAAAKSVGGGEIMAADHHAAKLTKLAEQYGIAIGDNREVAGSCTYIFLAVKPQGMAAMLDGIRPVLAKRDDRFVLVTMAAGLSIAQLLEMAGGAYPVIRMMPNTPAAVGEGMILYSTNEWVTPEETEEFMRILAHAGTLDDLPERLIDAACAVSGCGPAFVYLFAEALADGGVECGLPRSKALLYAAQTLLGSAKLMLESGQHPGQLKDAVCSPGGTTIAGVHALENGAFRACAMNAVTEAYRRAKELGK